MHTCGVLKERRENDTTFVNYTSNEVCLQNTITNLRVTADLDEVAAFLQAGEANKLPLNNNSVRQKYTSGSISIQLCRPKPVTKADKDEGSLSYGNHVKRSTYSLEEVSRSLDEVMASGKAIMKALAAATTKNRDGKHGAVLSKQTETNGSGILTKRGTYDLDKVAGIVDKDVREGTSLEDSLDGVSGHLNTSSGQGNNGDTSRIKRNTYDLSDVSIDESQRIYGTSLGLEELLRELGCEEDILVNTSSPSTINKRGTYDLDHVSEKLDDSISSGKCLEGSLEQMSLVDNNKYNETKRRTYDLSDVSNRLDQSVDLSSRLDDSPEPNASDLAVYEKRSTYNLSDVSNELDKSLNSGCTLEDCLQLISSTPEDQNSTDVKRRTYDLTDLELNLQSSNQDVLEKLKCNNNTIKRNAPDQQNAGKTVAETSSTALKDKEYATEKQKMYILNDEPSTTDVCLSNGSDDQSSYPKILPHQNGIHSNSHNVPEEIILPDRDKKKKLTPGQWMKQMNGLKNYPFKVSPEKIQNGNALGKTKKKTVELSGHAMKTVEQQTKASFRLDSDQSAGLKTNAVQSPGIKSSPKSTSERHPQSASKSKSNPRAKSLPGSTSDLKSRSSSEKRSKSVSSNPSSELKSNSTPEFSSSTPSKNDTLLENLKEVSPGVLNYLTNKLGLSEEQCVAVHRRLSSGSGEPVQPPSSEHRKTYSLDDVAHSLDIATSQGLPMTMVLDNLEENERSSSEKGIESREKNKKTNESEEQQHCSSSSIKEDKSDSLSEQSSCEKIGSLRQVKLPSTATQSKFSLNRRTYTLSNGFSEGKTTGTDATTSLNNLCEFKLHTKKAMYKPSAKLHSFSHLLGGKSAQNRLRSSKGGINESKRNTYTLESVAETLEKAQDAGVPMIDALKRLSGSCREEPSETSAEKRKTYSLEDVSNVLESATASGVPIADALQKIANPEDDKGIERGTTLRSSKKKAPPKPKRTFSKTEIKFETDSFVIEYYTSPKKSSSLETDASDSEETFNQTNCKSTGNVNGEVQIDGVKVTGVTHDDQGKLESSVVGKEAQGNSSCKVVDDLDDLLVKLAAEVDKTKELSSSSSERISIVSSSLNLVEESPECFEKVVGPGNVDHDRPGDCELSSDCAGPSQELRNSGDTEGKNIGACVPPGKTEQSSEESTDVLKSDYSEAGTVLVEPNSDCTAHEHENIDPFLPISDRDICSEVKASDYVDCLPLQEYGEPESKVENFDGDAIEKETPQMNNIKKISSPDDMEITVEKGFVNGMDNLHETHTPESDGSVSVGIEGDAILVEALKGSDQSANKTDTVVRELNLLRLKLAEKQRHIEAQKQRTKEQQEEERKRFGQNVFWFAVGKERERKDSNGIKKPKDTGLQKKMEPPLPKISQQTLNSSDVKPSSNEKFATYTKESSLDEELPPCMGKLQDRTYSLQSPDTGLTTSNNNHTEPSGVLHNQATRNPDTFLSPTKKSLSNSNLSEGIVHEFKLSRQASGSQDLLVSKTQTVTKPSEALGDSRDLSTHSGRVPVINYKSRISMPLSYTAKPASPISFNVNGPRDSAAGTGGVSYQDTSPTRKCWDIESATNDEPQLAVSKSNYHKFENNATSEGTTDNSTNRHRSPEHEQAAQLTNTGGTTAIDEQTDGSNQDGRAINEGTNSNRPGTFGSNQDTKGIDESTNSNVQGTFGNNQDNRAINGQVYTGGENTDLGMDIPNDNSERLGYQSDCNKELVSEKMALHENGGASEDERESPRSLEKNDNSLSDNDTPKKGLALFIGDENDVGEDGFTPDQLKKRERFLKNRQMKIEEEKMKKEVVLEKKRRKEEKMKEIQFRREQEEHGRHTRLQEKKLQAENAKQERQKYEMQRKENLTRTHVTDGIPGGYPGLSRTEMIPHGYSPDTGGMVTSGMNNGFVSTPSPSAFSGFTGVQSYVKPSGKTNRKIVINAISHVCLPGAVNKETKDKCLQAMTESCAQHFLILFREGLKFRGLYSLDPESNQVLKVHGVGPRSITEKMIQRLYKYNSGSKEFSEIPAKSFSLSVDGFTLQKSCWQSNKPSVASKTVSNYKSSTYRSTSTR